MKITIENRGTAPQGIDTDAGRLWIRPKQSRTVSVDEKRLPRISRIAGLVLTADGDAGEAKPDALPGLTGKNKADLLAIAKDEGVEIEEGATNNDIVAAIELHREATTQA